MEILSPEPDLAWLAVDYMGTTSLSIEGYANKIMRDRETFEGVSFKLLSRSSGGGYTRYRTTRLEFEVSFGVESCKAMVSDLIAIVEADQRIYHLVGVRHCPVGIEQYETQLDRILDSFFIYR